MGEKKLCLYVKTHNKTGLKYLGKTYRDPYKYKGSGKYWKRHIKKHGNDVTTEILKECKTEKQLKKWGMHYSKKWNVVKSKEWANLRDEYGDGVDPEFARQTGLKRVAAGTHNFMGKKAKEDARRRALAQVAAGTHIFQNKEWAQKEARRRVTTGIHNFLGGEIQRRTTKRRIENGTHNWLDGERQRQNALKRVYNGTHNLLKGNCESFNEAKRKGLKTVAAKKLADGTHPILRIYTCPHCGKVGQGSNMFRWHFQRCKLLDKDAHTPNTYTCPHCGKVGRGPSMFQWHFNKCKHKKLP